MDDACDLCENILFVWMPRFLLLHAGVVEKLLFLPRRESSSLSESSRELSFASVWVVAQARILSQARATSPKLEGLT